LRIGRTSKGSNADAAAAAVLAEVAPLCFGHQEPTRVVVVKKTGPNKGRQFFSCCRPREDQCDFFMYAIHTYAVLLKYMHISPHQSFDFPAERGMHVCLDMGYRFLEHLLCPQSALNVFFNIRWVEDHPDLVKATLLGDNAGSEGGGKQRGGDISLVGASEPNEARWRERQLRDLRKRTEHRTVRRI